MPIQLGPLQRHLSFGRVYRLHAAQSAVANVEVVISITMLPVALYNVYQCHVHCLRQSVWDAILLPFQLVESLRECCSTSPTLTSFTSGGGPVSFRSYTRHSRQHRSWFASGFLPGTIRHHRHYHHYHHHSSPSSLWFANTITMMMYSCMSYATLWLLIRIREVGTAAMRLSQAVYHCCICQPCAAFPMLSVFIREVSVVHHQDWTRLSVKIPWCLSHNPRTVALAALSQVAKATLACLKLADAMLEKSHEQLGLHRQAIARLQSLQHATNEMAMGDFV